MYPFVHRINPRETLLTRSRSPIFRNRAVRLFANVPQRWHDSSKGVLVSVLRVFARAASDNRAWRILKEREIYRRVVLSLHLIILKNRRETWRYTHGVCGASADGSLASSRVDRYTTRSASSIIESRWQSRNTLSTMQSASG